MKDTSSISDFLLNETPALLQHLDTTRLPLWGAMNAQQMVEHLSLTVKVSNGRVEVPISSPPDKIEKIKAIGLLSDRPLMRGVKNVLLPETPMRLRHADIAEAKGNLHEEIDKFFTYYKQKGEAHQRAHNVFGMLNYHEWLWFHYKHFHHHFTQFGLMPEKERIG